MMTLYMKKQNKTKQKQKQNKTKQKQTNKETKKQTKQKPKKKQNMPSFVDECDCVGQDIDRGDVEITCSKLLKPG